MKTIKALGLLGLAVSACFAAQAFATTIAPPTSTGGCPIAPATHDQTYAGPVCLAPQGSDGAGTGLGSVLGPAGTTNSIFSSGGGINPWTSQMQPSSFWSVNGTGGSENTVMLTLTGNVGTNTFGIFDPNDPSNMLTLFNGGSTAGYHTSLFYHDGVFSVTQYSDQYNANGTPVILGQSAANFGSNLFGYYLDVPKNSATFYSDASMNHDADSFYKNGTPHMIAYAGNGQGTVALTDGLFSSGEYILAWEDTPFANSDLDYNDFVVMVESVHPVPEPADLAIFGFGILLVGGFVALRRRRLNA